MTTYVGARHRDSGSARVFVEEQGAGIRALAHVCLHSPSGLEWGYGGSGPADCALSVLADYFGEVDELAPCIGRYNAQAVPIIERTRAGHLYQEFKWFVIASLARDLPEAGVGLRRPDFMFEGEAYYQVWRLDDDQVREAVSAILAKGRRCLYCMSLLDAAQACPNVYCPVSPEKV